MFQNSHLKISANGFFTTIPTVVMNDVEFYYSNWEFTDINIAMTNCNTSLLYLNVNSCEKNSSLIDFTSSVNIRNCTLGCWEFFCINDVQITDCSIIGNLFCCNKMIMSITNSSAVLDNVSIQNVNFNCSSDEMCGLVVDLFSEVLIKNSFYGKNKNVSISVHNRSNLVMKNCDLLDNDVYDGVIFGLRSVLYIINCIIRNNTGSKSGTICLIEHSAIIVNNSTFINNLGQNSGGGVGVAYSSALMIDNSTFIDNLGFAGGAISAHGNSRLNISKSVFDGNSATAGGAIFAEANCTVICVSSNFSNNLASSNGAAIAVQTSNATVSHLIITENHATTGVLSFVGSYFIDIYSCVFAKNTGGAVFVYGVIELVVTNSDFFQNKANFGAAIYMEECKKFSMVRGRLFQNVASVYGGAIASEGVNLYIDSSIFEANSAFQGGVATEFQNVSTGNGNFGSGGVFYVHMGSLLMSNCSAKHNSAAKGGVILGNQCNVSLMYCFFENNTAYLNGGAHSITNSYFKADSVTYLNNSVNTFGNGGAISAEQCNMYVIDSLFYGNYALMGSAGAIHISAEVLKIFNTTFSYNNANGAGALEVSNVGKIQLSGSIFVDNFSAFGGVINVTRSTFVAIDSMFDRNVAGQYTNSGCMVFHYGEATFENCTFSNNRNPGFKNEGKGGAITSVHCELRISTSIFDNNEAYYGKDVFLNNDLLTYISTFKHSTILKSNDKNFKQKVFEDNIFWSAYPQDVMISETLYASSTIFLYFQ